jgi:hypothetical protein
MNSTIALLKRLTLALAAGALLFATTCTLTDLLSTYGLSSILDSLSTSG